jgi:hypothetical protein
VEDEEVEEDCAAAADEDGSMRSGDAGGEGDSVSMMTLSSSSSSVSARLRLRDLFCEEDALRLSAGADFWAEEEEEDADDTSAEVGTFEARSTHT